MAGNTDSISVLCVDDEPGVVDLIATFLERHADYLSTVTATNATEGLEILGTGDTDIDCILSDYDMPGMDGLAFLQTVRSEHPDLPFILFTGRGSEEIASEAISAGVTDYMQKEAGTDQYAFLAQRIRNAVERVHAQTQVTDAQQRAQTILKASPDAILVNVEGEYVYANAAAVDLFDADSEEDLLGLPVLDLVHPDDQADVEAAIEAVQAGDQTITRINRTFQTLDGESVPVQVTARNITWDGQTAILAIIRDISHQREVQHAQDRYRATFEKAFDAMVIADDEGRYIDVNPSACDLFGLPREDLLGRRVQEFAPAEYDFEAAWQQFQESERERGTFPLIRANGERRTVKFAATPNIIPGEHLSILRDITDRKQREQELERQNEQLEEFASIVSHDLRNPLSAARGYSELAREEGDPEYFERIDHNLDRMDRIIEDVRWLAQEGRGLGATEEVRLAEAIEDSWKILVPESVNAKLVYEEGELGNLTADYDRLCQLLENIFGNAIKHGGPGVTVKVKRTEDGFAIEDDGPGIPDSIREQVFEEGFSTEDDGTGFGLYIVKQIVEAHGWEVDVAESETGGVRIEITDIENPSTDA